MLDLEINEFGRRLGLPGLALDDNGRAGVRFDVIGMLTLEAGEGSEEDVLRVVLAVPVEPSDAAVRYDAALRRVSWRSALPYSVSTALFRDQLIWSVRLPARSVTAAALENALRFLLDEAARR